MHGSSIQRFVKDEKNDFNHRVDMTSSVHNFELQAMETPCGKFQCAKMRRC